MSSNENNSRSSLGTTTAKLDNWAYGKCLYAVTVSPSTGFKPRRYSKTILSKYGLGSLGGVSYGRYTPDIQMKVMKMIIESTFSDIDDYWFTHELNSKGNIHAHGLVEIDDDNKFSDYWLATIRKTVSLMHGNRNIIHFFHIVKVDDAEKLEEWKTYCKKDIGKVKRNEILNK